MWVRPAALPSSDDRAVLLDMNGRFGISLDSDGKLHCRDAVSTTALAVGTWVHVACVHDLTTVSAYVGGAFEASASGSLDSTVDFVGVGQDSPDADEGFVGALDSLRIWGVALDAQAVAAAAAR
jgi:hypothetical protein